MKGIDIILLILVGLAVAGAVRLYIGRKKDGSSCCGGDWSCNGTSCGKTSCGTCDACRGKGSEKPCP